MKPLDKRIMEDYYEKLCEEDSNRFVSYCTRRGQEDCPMTCNYIEKEVEYNG